jgi:hypothetical protein
MFDVWCMVYGRRYLLGIRGIPKSQSISTTYYEEKDVLSQQNNDVIEEQPCLTRFRIVT